MSYGKPICFIFQKDFSESQVLFDTQPLWQWENDPRKHCDLVCNKIGHYLQQKHGIELISMTVEFAQDEFGKVWLVYADEVWVR